MVHYSGEPLTVQSPGTQTRSFCYVSDLVYISHIFLCIFESLTVMWLLLFMTCLRLMALSVSWKDPTLGQSTLETQVSFLLQGHGKFLYSLLSLPSSYLFEYLYISRWIYNDWTCWDRERGQFLIYSYLPSWVYTLASVFKFLVNTLWAVCSLLIQTWRSRKWKTLPMIRDRENQK